MDAPSMVQRSGDNFIIRRVISGDQLVLDQKGSIIDNPSSTLSASEIQARTNILSQHLVNFDKKISGYININNNLLKNDYAIGLGVGIGVNAGGGVGSTGSGSGGGGGGNNGNGERSTSPMNSSAITATAISGATGNEAATDSDLLPQCKIKRNYSCNNCTYYTQNPRKYLTHLRDIHGEKIVINECKHCLYASRHYQKLVRHMKMVHGSTEGINEPNHSRKRSSQNMNSTKKRKIGTPNLNNMLQSGSNNNNNNNNHNNNNSLNNNNIIINNNNSNNNNIHHSNNNNNKNNETSLENLDYLHAMDLHQLQQLQQHRQQQQQQQLHHQQLQQQHHHQQQLPAVCNDKTNNNNNTINNNKMLKCTVCEYTTPFRDHLLNHEKDEHVKTKFFRCLKCSYVTHIKARYSKHVKYHSMPMIKCMLCDFQTPYKWNLDRHSKNHGGSGGFKCSLCNFTADIKQSLTVHEMNHHVPVSGTGAGMGMTGTGMGTGAGSIWQGGGILGGGRRKNKVGGTDLIDFDDDYPIPNMHDFHDFHDMYEHEFKTEETDDMDDDHNCDGGDRDDDDDEAPMNLKVVPKLEPSYSPSKKPSRPVPNLIPIQNNVQMLSNMQIMKNLYAFEQKLIQHHSPNGEKSSNSSLKDYSTMYNNDGYVTNDDSDSNGTPPEASPAHSSSFSIFKKKNYTFFDKLKEKLITSSGDDENLTCQCGYMAKSLSDSILHQKNCGKKSEHMNASSGSSKSSLGSTRCKYCRHRCKSSADLLIHLENCYEKSVADEPMHTPEYLSDEAVVDDPNVAVPHPLENVVFVWNKFENENKSPSNAMKDIQMQQEDSNTSSDMARNDNTYYGIETAPGYGEVTKQISPEETKNSATMKKVFKCPHCSFWASTASRFHVHIVGHLNKKPFECSLCSYRSNWRWDITKHIRLKTIRDPSHKNAQVLMNDETGRRNYTKYNKYISLMKVSDDIDFMRNSKINALGLSDSVVQTQSQLLDSLNNLDEISVIASYNEAIQNLTSANASDSLRAGGNSEDNNDNKKTHFKCRKCNFKDSDRHNVLNHVKEHYREAGLISEDNNSPSISNNHSRSSPAAGSAAGYSNYEDRLNHHDLSLLKNSSSSASATTTQQSQHLQIVESNILQSPLSTTQNSSSSSVNLTNLNGEMDEANSKGISGLTGWRGSAFRCAHCHQESNWKHVIQRHCRLKHNGNIAIEIIGSGSDSHKHNNESKRTATTTITTSTPINNNNNHSEKKTIKYDGVNINYNSKDIVNNSINISNNNINIHNNINMDHNISNINNSKNHNLSVSQNDAVMSANTDDFNDDGSKKESHELAAGTSLSPPPMIMMGKTKTKRYKCHNCPYVTDSKSQFLYHKSFHKPRGEPFQCSYCSYNVTKRHLLNQHVKMHIAEKSKNETAESIKKSNEIEAIDLTTASTSSAAKRHDAGDSQQIMEINNVERQIYFCNLCPARYLSLKEIKVHQNFHNEENGNKCGACTYSTANDSYLNEHKIVHTTYYQEKTKEFLIKYKTNVDYEQPELKEVNDLKFTSEPYWIVPYKIGDLDDMIVSSVVPNINNNNNNNINNHNNNVNISSNLKKSNVNSNANTNNSSTDDEREKEKEKEIEKEKDKKKDGDSTTDKERNDNKIHTRQYLKINPIHQLRKSKRTQNAETNESKLQSKHVIYEKNDEDEDIVKCRFCPFSTSSTSIMKEHLLHHFSVSGLEDSYKCIHCDFSIDDSIKLHEHCKFHFVAITNPCKVSFYTNFDNIKIGYYPSEQPTDDAVSEADDEDNLDLNQITVTDKPNEKFEIVYDSDKMYTRLNEENGSNDEKIIINI